MRRINCAMIAVGAARWKDRPFSTRIDLLREAGRTARAHANDPKVRDAWTRSFRLVGDGEDHPNPIEPPVFISNGSLQ